MSDKAATSQRPGDLLLIDGYLVPRHIHERGMARIERALRGEGTWISAEEFDRRRRAKRETSKP